MKKLFFTLIFSFSCILHISSQVKTVKYPKDYKAALDVIYTKVEQWKGRIDLYTNPKAKTPTPIIINIHGGGWANGKKEHQGSFKFFFKNGFAVANVEYRLRAVAKAPGAIEDVRCALIYIHKNAKELNIDTNKIVVMGSSAGGHLALMTGLLNNNKRFDTNCNYEPEIKIAAIINKYGATDLNLLTYKGSVKKWIGNKIDDKNFIKTISPLTYVNKNSPPTFSIHGDEDPSIPYKQSKLLNKKLKKFRVKTKLIIVKGGKHGRFSKEENKNFYKKVELFFKELNII